MSDTENRFNDLYGQFAALEHLVLAMYEAHPNKVAVQVEFLRQTTRNADLDLATTRSEAFLEGFAIRAKILSKNIAMRNAPPE